MALGGVLAAPAAAQVATPAAPVTVDGPSPDIVGLSGVSVARDGTGGLTYVKNVGGIPRVFVSRLLGGVFRQPEQVDSTLAGASSQPVIAAGNGGVLLIAFVNGGVLIVVQAGSASQGFSAPNGLIGGASNPSLSLSNLGKAYLAFTVADGAGSDVRAAYWAGGQWALEAVPLNVVPADDAGTGTGRPQVATAGDGVGIVVWGEGGHVMSRRVWGVSPSVVVEQADAPLPGCSELSAGDPVAGVGGDSSYVGVSFKELLSCNGQRQQRVLFNRLRGSQYDGVTPADALSSGSADGAEQPQIVMSEYGAGWIVSTRDRSNPLDVNQIFAMALSNSAASNGTGRVDSLANTGAPHAVAGTAGLYSNLIAWQQTPGTSGLPEIRVRYTPARASTGPEAVVSSPQQGPVDAADGLDVAGDVNGDAVAAWVQGAPVARQIVTAQLYQAPGGFHPVKPLAYARNPHPLLSWSPARAPWQLTYHVIVDGVEVAQTAATSIRIPGGVSDGPHRWQAVAVNPAGLQSQAQAATVFVDQLAPIVKFSVLGTRRVSSRLQAYISYLDAPPPLLPATDASGVAKVTVDWGDRTPRFKMKLGNHRAFHPYAKAGRYRVTVTVVDVAGNTTRAATVVKVKPKAKPHRKRPHKKRGAR
jgi:hypothetical protein